MDLLLPKDGSIIIIDDQYREAKPLLDLLSSNGYPSIYFNGNLENLPKTHLNRVRLIFADIQLVPNLNEDQYAQIILEHLDKLIPAVNGPYILVIWSGKEDLYADKIEEVVLAESFAKKPISIIRLNKNDYFKTVNQETDFLDFESFEESISTMFNKDDIKRIINALDSNLIKETRKEILPNALTQISKKLKIGIKKYKAFEFLIEWEYIVSTSSKEFIANISEIHTFNGYWDYNFRNIIARMAEAQVGKYITKLNSKEFIEAAFKTLNAAFMDTLNDSIPASFIYPNLLKDYNQTGFTVKLNNIEYRINWKKFKKFELYINGQRKGEKDDVSAINKVPNLGEEKLIVEQVSNRYSEFNPALNTRIHLDFVTKNPLQPGIVYEIQPHYLRKRRLLNETYFRNINKKNGQGKFELVNSDLKKIKFIELEVSPNCDFAQNKWVKNRFISGILLPLNIEKKYKLDIRSDLSIYEAFPSILINKEIYRIYFSFKLFKSLDFEISKNRIENVLFRIKNEAMADIISRMASHATRIGLIEFK